MKLDKKDIARIRFYKSGLTAPFGSVKECLSKLFGIQAQMQQFGELSIFNCVKDISASDLQKAYKKYEVVKIWGQRLTVHMYNKEDWKTVHGIYAYRDNFIKEAWSSRKKTFKQVLDELDMLTSGKTVSKTEIKELIERNAPRDKNPYRDYGVIMQATLDGIIFGIPCSPQTKHFANRNTCIPDTDASSWGKNKDAAYEHIIKNYFANYGPATLSDFYHWSGLRKKETEKHFARLSGSFSRFESGGKTYFFIKDDKTLTDAADGPPVKLLGKFDPLFVSFADKSWIAGEKQQKAVWRPAGHVEAVVIAQGALAGCWRYEIKGKKADFNIELFHSLSGKTKKLIAFEAEKVSKFLSKELNKINYI